MTVNIVRVVVDGKVVVKEAPKSERSARTLPLDDALVAALTALHKRQAAEKLAAGPAYRTADMWPVTSWARPSIRNGSPMSSAGCVSAPGWPHHPARDSPHGRQPDGEGRGAGLHPGGMVRPHHRGQQEHVHAPAAGGPGRRA